ncbi:transposase [Rhodococcus sp. NPDC056960]|uniref:transposase n=1 Tax=Rhodococcus sp. NPDC056960 TaxID=3345982 RepID=UPI00363B7AB6
MSRPRRRYPEAVRDSAVQMVLALEPDMPSRWAAIETVSARTGIHTSTVRTWVRAAVGVTVRGQSDSAEVRRLRAELDALSITLQNVVTQLRGSSA